MLTMKNMTMHHKRIIQLLVAAGCYYGAPVAHAAKVQTESVLVQTAAHQRLTPLTLAATSDDGMLVAGGSAVSKETWAVKFDAARRLQWQYARQAPAAERQAVIGGSNPSSYRGVAEMADGSFFLCAEKPFTRGDPPAGMYLTHLSRDGQLLSELPIRSPGLATDRNFILAGCSAWGGDLAVLAYAMSWPPGPVMSLGRLGYLLLAFDASGALKWELPVASFHAGSAPGPDGIVFQQNGASLVVSTTSNIWTELMRFSPTGKITAHRSVEGRHLLVQSAADAPELKLLGLDIQAGRFTHSLTVLAEDLTPQSVVKSDHPSAFLVSSAFEKADGTLLMFGSDIDREGSHMRAGMRQLDRALAAERPLETAFGHFRDPFSIAAGLRRNRQAFAYATEAEPRDAGVTATNDGAAPAAGALLNFAE